ncbi:MAG: hypothetical protein DWQ51_03150 [Microcystis wesenbergii TW10]|uniref:Uncharacterized protein n=1 Tax=Microcystis wesenbergii TW10 TaxID=2060474 RepID=A0A3E0MC03_9CHRO|nr:MAG: hypothetical protein DWQ51_03150 [Microcystis wesenbergii TW10]
MQECLLPRLNKQFKCAGSLTFGFVGFRLNKRIELFSTQYCCAQPNHYKAMGSRNLVIDC